jgi:CHAT domain-containing protein/tetratricopeptide (TPR) repeat protein
VIVVSSEQQLLAALQMLEGDIDRDAKVDLLLSRFDRLLTPHLWESMMAQAAAVYYGSVPTKALSLYELALAIAGKQKDEAMIGATYYRMGLTYSGLGENSKAIEMYRASDGVFRRAGLTSELSSVLGDLSSLYFAVQDFARARASAEEALAIAENPRAHRASSTLPPEQYGHAGAFSTLGSLSQRDGNYFGAIEYFKKSLSLYERIDGGTMEYGLYIADKLSLLGGVCNLVGENGVALSFLSRGLEMSRRLSYPHITAGILNNLGSLYFEQEDYERAANYFVESANIFRAGKNRLETARTSMNLALTALRQGDFDRALGGFEECVTEARALSNIDLEIAATEGIGATSLAQGRYERALEHLDYSLRVARANSEVLRTAELLWLKAQVSNAIQKFDDATTFANEALVIARAIGQPKLTYLITTTLGEAYIGSKKTELAESTLSKAIEQLEDMRRGVAGQQQERQLFLGNHLTAYHDLVNLFVEQGRLTKALEYAERAKARVLLDIVTGVQLPVSKTMSRQERVEEQRLNREVVDANNEIRSAQGRAGARTTDFEELRRRRDSARMRYADFNDLIWSSHSELQKSAKIDLPLKSNRFRNFVQDGRTALLEYVVTANETQLFVLTSGTAGYSVTSCRIDVSRKDLIDRVEEFRRMMSDRRPDYLARSQELFNLLVRPAIQALRGSTTLCIVPDGPLWEVPFHILQDPAAHSLLEKYAIYYAPSLSVLDRTSFTTTVDLGRRSLLALGNPVVLGQVSSTESWIPSEILPEAEKEAYNIVKTMPTGHSRVLVGADADEKTVKAVATQYSMLHFATHGVLDNRNALYSFLVLAPGEDKGEDGLLEAREIMNMSLKADLVVLSACETARGRIGAGEGVIGMSWAFFAAGCRTTLVSQWKVNSTSTSELMMKFYQYLKPRAKGKKRTKAEALRLASLDLMRDERYRHPFYWAPFVLVGSN